MSTIFSWDYKELSLPEHFFIESRAYVECSYEIFKKMQRGNNATYHRAKVAAFNFAHGLELFLKGANYQAIGENKPIHKLKQIYEEYKKNYPEKEYEFKSDIKGFVENKIGQPYHQYFKYPINQNGKKWEGNTHFNIKIWKDAIKKYLEEIEMLESKIKSKYKKT
jgi:hypothetical protein